MTCSASPPPNWATFACSSTPPPPRPLWCCAARHRYLADIKHIDHELLATIGHMTAHLKVGICRAADWEHAILTGYAAWRQLRKQNGGTAHLDLDQRTLTVIQD
ncbi:hypothetical protein ACIBL5_34230 [Streptomyces sp. NPDC050516]|uniref:hypothetical protein n=1 Tax=Streptomyces sp. NPDC050516 TaxID=3365621 RepID=UPI00379E20E4